MSCQSGSDAFAVDVESEDVVAEFGELLATGLLVVGEPGPLMDDEDGGTRSGDRIVIRVESFKGGAIVIVVDVILHECGKGGQREEKQWKESSDHPLRKTVAEGCQDGGCDIGMMIAMSAD